MTSNLSPAALALPEDFHALLLKYRPKCMSETLWQLVRADVLDLVAHCGPSFPREVPMLAGTLCKLIATFADQTENPSVDGLLTQMNVDALLARFDLAKMPAGTYGQQQVRLRRLLRTHVGTPTPGPPAPRRSRDLDPYTVDEVSTLVARLERSPVPVRQSGLDALLLGLGHGIVLPHTEDVTAQAAGRLTWKGRLLPAVHDNWGPTILAHQAHATALSRKDWEGVRAWLLWQHPSLDLSAQRLRDTWLLFRTGTVSGLLPIVALMADGVGRERLMRAAAEPLECSDSWDHALRAF